MRFRFTIRDWLWLTLVLALAVLWRIERMQFVSAFRKLNDKYQALYASKHTPEKLARIKEIDFKAEREHYRKRIDEFEQQLRAKESHGGNPKD